MTFSLNRKKTKSVKKTLQMIKQEAEISQKTVYKLSFD